MIFVFGSNLAGRHGRGAALEAKKHWDAQYGVGKGRTGAAYAIPTKDGQLNTLDLEYIYRHVQEFIEYAKCHQELKFLVTRIGCGLAGYTDEEIAPMFQGAPANCNFCVAWEQILK